MENPIIINANTIVVALFENNPDSKKDFEGSEIAELTGLDIASIDDAIEYCDSQFWIDRTNYKATGYNFGCVGLNVHGKNHYYDLINYSENADNYFSDTDCRSIESRIEAVFEDPKFGVVLHGQQQIFAELEEMKQLIRQLRKKSWIQLLASKLWDLVKAEVLTKEVAREIWNTATSGLDSGFNIGALLNQW